eukprot:14019228-Alexandrium_andersonii.AAC.1
MGPGRARTPAVLPSPSRLRLSSSPRCFASLGLARKSQFWALACQRAWIARIADVPAYIAQ